MEPVEFRSNDSKLITFLLGCWNDFHGVRSTAATWPFPAVNGIKSFIPFMAITAGSRHLRSDTATTSWFYLCSEF